VSISVNLRPKIKMAIAKIIENKSVTPLIFRMLVEGERIARKSMPGQFVNIRVGGGYYPLLRRPMSVHYTDGDRFAILYNVKGLGTELLSTYSGGDQIDVLGPLGNPFESLINPRKGKLYLVAGGMGIAPLYFLYREAGGFLTMGAKNKDGILPVEEMEYGRSDFLVATERGKREERREMGYWVNGVMGHCGKREDGKEKGEEGEGGREDEHEQRITNTDLRIVTEDGSIGKRGLVTDYLPDVSDGFTVVACGPILMLKKVKEFYSHRKVNCILSLEARMGCGYGVCLSCAVRTKSGYKYVCKDGPAFRAEDVGFDYSTPSPSIS